ncbi:MAG: site-specific DNA-methyltransferase [Leucobacter sp.]
MTQRNIRGRLELTWMGKDQALIPTAEGAYDYTWVSKDDPRACQTHYLIDDGHFGNLNDGGIHDNLLITGESGDVLEALTRVPELVDQYAGQVKCVYIDPPFNTGGVFTHYEDNLEHSVWLTFMRDRLILLKKLLADDGSIWVHLDDSENHRMRALLDEVFGSANFAAEIVWQKTDSSRNDFPIPSADHDIILVYRKSEDWVMNRLERTEEMNARFTAPDGDPEVWWDADPTAPSASRNQLWVYAIQHPITGELVYPSKGRCWFAEPGTVFAAMSEYAEYELRDLDDAEMRAKIAKVPVAEVREGVKAMMLKHSLEESATSARERYDAGTWPEVVLRGGGEGGFGRKTRIPTRGRVPSTWWPNEEVGHNRQATAELAALFPGADTFDTPKPERLIERILKIATNPGDIVLDCFAGSGTTAAVAHKMGRRWVTCELQQSTMASFTRPRLEQVVRGTDAGGVTSSEKYEAKAELPAKTTVKEAKLFNTILGRVLKEAKAAEVELDAATIKTLKAATATKKITTVNWTGGGGFTRMHLSPVWVEVETDERTGTTTSFITPEATGEVLQHSIAGHLGFRLTPENPRFVGAKGRQLLAVVEGMLSESILTELLAALPENHSLTVVCDGAAPGVDRELRKQARGSRLLVMPDDLFTSRRNR